MAGPPASHAELDAALRRLHSPFADSALRNAHEAPAADVPAVHAEVSAALTDLIQHVRQDRRSRLQLVLGDPGEGKTHLLCRLRQRAESSWRDAAAQPFALGIVPPLRDPAQPFRHILREAASSLAQPLPRGTGAPAAHDPDEPDPAGADDPQPGSQLERLGWLALARGLRYLGRTDPLYADWGQEHVPRYLGSFAARVRDEWPELGYQIVERLRPWADRQGLLPELWQAICRLPVEGAAHAALSWMKGTLLPEQDLAYYGLPPPLDGEDGAYRVLVSLSRCSGVPLVLGFDQIEGLRRQGEEAVARFFAALVELFSSGAPLVLICFCQTTVFAELRQRLEQQILDRLEKNLVLRPLEPDTVVALCAGRLAPAWRAAGLPPPYPTYPFTEAELRSLPAQNTHTPRQVLKYLAQRLGDWAATVGEQVRAVPPLASPAARLLAELLEQEQRGSGDRTPEVRADLVRHALFRALRAAQAAGQVVAGTRIAEVHQQPLRVTLERGPARRRVHLEISNSAHGMSAMASVRRLRGALEDSEAEVALLVREQMFSLPPAAQEAVRKESGRGLGVLWLSHDEVPPLAALEGFLNAAADSDISHAEAELLCAEQAAELSATRRLVEQVFTLAHHGEHGHGARQSAAS